MTLRDNRPPTQQTRLLNNTFDTPKGFLEWI